MPRVSARDDDDELSLSPEFCFSPVKKRKKKLLHEGIGSA